MAGDDAAERAPSGAPGTDSGEPALRIVRLTARQMTRATEQSPIGMALISLDGTFEWVNETFCRLLERTRDEVTAHSCHEFTHPEDTAENMRLLGDLASGRAFAGERLERYLRPDGSAVWVRVFAGAVLDETAGGGGVSGVSIQVVDVSEQIAAQEARAHAEASASKALADLRYRSSHDTLTGLLNRRSLLSSLDGMLAEASNRGEGLAVLFCDLDNLKEINDAVSHEAGDAILIQLADSLRRSLRARDLVGRVGGDEFVVVLSDVIDPGLATRIAGQIQDRAAIGLDALVGLRVPAGVSIGVRMAEAGVSGAQMLRDADAALHEAKLSGRGLIVVFDEQMQDRMEWIRRVRSSLAAAIESGQIHAWFQPVVDLETHSVVGYEALARWVGKERVLDASEWIGAVLESPLIAKVGDIVFRESIVRLASLPDPVWIAVNVSAREIGTPTFVPRLMDELDRHNVSPNRLIVEVTESVVMDRVIVRRQLDALVDAGIRLHFDDFGTGYASLNHLNTLPVSGVKLDQTFTRNLSGTADTIAIVRGIAGLAGALGLSGVAEGIETPDQAAILRDAGWQYGQGYLFGHAMA